jgi:hypothetical protein
MADRWDDHVLPHGDLEALAPGLWHVQGTLKHQPLPRAMAVYRMPDGRLWLHSAIALDDARRGELEALGPIGVLLVPSGMHRLDAAVYKERYPEALVVCPAAARAAVEKVVPVDATAEEVLSDLGVGCIQPPGLKPDELVYELPLPDDGVALVFCDALFHLDHLPGCSGRMLHWLGSTGFFGTTFIGRMFLADKAGWKGWLLQQGERDDLRVIHVAHGDPITEDCARRMREAGERL